MKTETIRLLVSKGMSAEDILEIAESMDQPKPRSAAAQRQARYRARLDVTYSQWLRLRAQVFDRDNFACRYCGAEDDLACDHVLPLIQGGKSIMENLATACRECNSGKSGRTLEEWRS